MVTNPRLRKFITRSSSISIHRKATKVAGSINNGTCALAKKMFQCCSKGDHSKIRNHRFLIGSIELIEKAFISPSLWGAKLNRHYLKSANSLTASFTRPQSGFECRAFEAFSLGSLSQKSLGAMSGGDTQPMKNRSSLPPTYESEILAVLALEYSARAEEQSDKKIKRRLREKKLGTYDPARIDRLRQFMKQLRKELECPKSSIYYTPQGGRYSDLKDFNISEMVRAFAAEYPEIQRSTLELFVPYVIYLYYLR